MEHDHKRIYTCPMHLEVRAELPGLCPECGMQLLREEVKDNHSQQGGDTVFDKPSFAEATAGKHAGHKTQSFLQKFWVSFILTIPVVLYSDLPEKLFDFEAPAFSGSAYMPLIFASIVFFYGGWVFLAGAYRELKARLPGMMTLISLAVSTAYFYSIFATLFEKEGVLFWELTTLITIMLLGHWVEMKAVSSAQGALKELSKLLPDMAEVIRDGKMFTVSLSELRIGDIVLIKPGARVPADGIVRDGRSHIDESIITGESKPVSKEIGSEVIAGTINGDGVVRVEVTRIGEQTFLSGVMRLVQEAQASKSRLQTLADRAAYYLTIVAVFAGFITFVAWILMGAGFSSATERLVAVLVIACPHALGLAVPLVASISTTKAARHGFLVKQRLALEAARDIQTVLFDKTGTLTQGNYGVEKIISASGSDSDMLRFAASVDSHSEHFVARAIVREANKRHVQFPEPKDTSRVPGRGIHGIVEDQDVYVGGEGILENAGVTLLPEFFQTIRLEQAQGKTVIFVVRGGELLGAIALSDILREESREAIQELKQLGIKIAMMTGDSEEVAKWVADELQIDEYFSRVLPEEKAAKVKLLQSEGRKVAMVGDGVNDAPALTQADLGIAIGAGTNVAIESAGIILVKNDPRDIVKIIKLSRMTYSKMIQNLFWATGYNIVALPLAAGVLASQGIVLQPAVAALFMSLSTVIVAVNAMFLKWRKI